MGFFFLNLSFSLLTEIIKAPYANALIFESIHSMNEHTHSIFALVNSINRQDCNTTVFWRII